MRSLLLAAVLGAGLVIASVAGEMTGLGRVAAVGGPGTEEIQDSVAILLRNRLSTPGEAELHSGALAKNFYHGRNYDPAWSHVGVVNAGAVEMVRLLREAEKEGLEPEEYRVAEIDDLLRRIRLAQGRGRKAKAQDLATLDLFLSDAFLTYGTHLLRGRIDPRTIHPGWVLEPHSADLTALLAGSIRRGTFGEAIAALRPTHPGYLALRRALQRYREIDRRGGWATVLPGPTVRPGDRGESVVRLRERLAREIGRARSDSAQVYDATLESAVREFQRSHGLRDDGLVGPGTRAALNVSAATRVSQIEIGLERQRWLPADLGPVHVLVRIPAFELDVVERGRPELSMRIIGGRPDWRTPIFSARISSVVFSPYWNIPASIADREVVPAARRNPDYLDRNEIRVVSGYGTAERTVSPRSIDWGNYDAYRSGYRLRQEPGPQNPLGGVKFLFPNTYNVYLHDTPGKDLFAEPERAFSHGCMRVEKPLEMAEYLLRGLGWNRARIEEVIARRVERSVALPEPVPVHILYQTVWVDADGRVHFRKDLYGYDQRLARARVSTGGEVSELVSGDCPTVAAVTVPGARSEDQISEPLPL